MILGLWHLRVCSGLRRQHITPDLLAHLTLILGKVVITTLGPVTRPLHLVSRFACQAEMESEDPVAIQKTIKCIHTSRRYITRVLCPSTQRLRRRISHTASATPQCKPEYIRHCIFRPLLPSVTRHCRWLLAKMSRRLRMQEALSAIGRRGASMRRRSAFLEHVLGASA